MKTPIWYLSNKPLFSPVFSICLTASLLLEPFIVTDCCKACSAVKMVSSFSKMVSFCHDADANSLTVPCILLTRRPPRYVHGRSTRHFPSDNLQGHQNSQHGGVCVFTIISFHNCGFSLRRFSAPANPCALMSCSATLQSMMQVIMRMVEGQIRKR